MFRVTPIYVEQLREEGYDLWTISLWEQWLALQPRLDQAIDKLRTAFDGVILGPGIGLREADAMDGYGDHLTLEAERALDEKERWQDIDVEMLNTCHIALSFFDAVGFKFHFPNCRTQGSIQRGLGNRGPTDGKSSFEHRLD